MEEPEPEIREAKRIKQFAAFFKNYMGVSSFVVAALPVPVTMLRLIPVFAEDAGSLSVITSLICFLILAFIFFNRHSLARRLFEPAFREIPASDGPPLRVRTGRWTSRRSKLPWTIALLIGASMALFLLYLFLIQALYREFATGAEVVPLSVEEHRILLIGTYAGFFATAEAAFVLMATKEYLQDLLKISEHDLIDPGAPDDWEHETPAPPPPPPPHPPPGEPGAD